MKNVHKNDARKVDQKTLHSLRDQAIELRENGISNLEPVGINRCIGSIEWMLALYVKSAEKKGQSHLW